MARRWNKHQQRDTVLKATRPGAKSKADRTQATRLPNLRETNHDQALGQLQVLPHF